MSEARADDTLMEIGDIEEEPTTAPGPPPQVVIEYRDRGVPWMLVPPLLVVAAVVAVVVALNLNAKWNPRRPTVVIATPPAGSGAPGADPSASRQIPVTQVLPPALVPDPTVIENPPSIPVATDSPKTTVADVAPTASLVADSPLSGVEAAPSPGAEREPVAPPAPQVALGFDPAALSNPLPAAPSIDRDRAVAQAGQPGDMAAVPNPADQPAQVDPDLLPPDPRRARFDRQKRAIEARRKLEGERVEFHANLAAVTKRLGARARPAIDRLCQEYEQEIPPSALDQAKKALGKTGILAGASTADRIALLRSLGFPESAILGDIYDISTRHESPDSRHLPNQDAMYVQAALTLLRHPPTRARTSTRAASTPGRTNTTENPAASSR